MRGRIAHAKRLRIQHGYFIEVNASDDEETNKLFEILQKDLHDGLVPIVFCHMNQCGACVRMRQAGALSPENVQKTCRLISDHYKARDGRVYAIEVTKFMNNDALRQRILALMSTNGIKDKTNDENDADADVAAAGTGGNEEMKRGSPPVKSFAGFPTCLVLRSLEEKSENKVVLGYCASPEVFVERLLST
jgi:hypothetical protein